MKKLTSCIIAIFVVFSLCGCSTDDNSSDVLDVIIEEEIIDMTTNSPTSSDNTVTTPSNDNIISDTSDEENPINSNVSNIKIDYSTEIEMDICDPIVRAYLDADKADMQYSILKDYVGVKYNYQAVSLDWQLDGSAIYTITISENADFSNPYTLETRYKTIKNTIFIPGKTYYWKATGQISDTVLGGGKLKIYSQPTRWIYIDGVNNVRDMGGWKTNSGKTVKYGMIYRGGELNNITEEGLKTLKALKISTEFDIRGEKNNPSPTDNTNLNYLFFNTTAGYHNVITNAQMKENYKQMFNYLSDKQNYPIYTHCQGGADRTGTFAFLLNGLLGVSYEDLTRDFELTSFSGNKRWRSKGNGSTFDDKDEMMYDGDNPIAWRELYNAMMEYGQENSCSTLSQSIEHWLLNSVGVSQSQIDGFKSIMLE